MEYCITPYFVKVIDKEQIRKRKLLLQQAEVEAPADQCLSAIDVPYLQAEQSLHRQIANATHSRNWSMFQTIVFHSSKYGKCTGPVSYLSYLAWSSTN